MSKERTRTMSYEQRLRESGCDRTVLNTLFMHREHVFDMFPTRTDTCTHTDRVSILSDMMNILTFETVVGTTRKYALTTIGQTYYDILRDMKTHTVDKKTYESWEQTVRTQFGTKPFKYMKHKVIVVVWERTDWMNLEEKKMANLTNVYKPELFHMGSKKVESVKYGYDAIEHKFSFAATDTGGLTNHHIQTNGGDDTPWVFPTYSENRQAQTDVFTDWLMLSNKSSFHSVVQADFDDWYTSVTKPKVFKDPVFGHVQLKPGPLNVVHASDVKDATGVYYTRNYGGDDSRYANVVETLDTLYCAITDSYITPNINDRNVHNEYAFRILPVRGVRRVKWHSDLKNKMDYPGIIKEFFNHLHYYTITFDVHALESQILESNLDVPEKDSLLRNVPSLVTIRQIYDHNAGVFNEVVVKAINSTRWMDPMM
jgi:hypothetical protein